MGRRSALVAAALQAVLILARAARAQPAQTPEIPKDGWIVFGSNRADARMEIYISRADGSEVKRLTDTGGTFPSISPDGRWIAYRNDANEAFFMRPDGSDKRKLNGWPWFWLHDGSGFAVEEEAGNVYVRDPDTYEKTLLLNRDTDFPEARGSLFHLYAMTHDNRYLMVGSDMYINGRTGANGTFQQAYSAILIDMLDKRKIYMVGAGCWPFTPPEGDLVYHIRGDLNGDAPTWPDIYRMNLADLGTRRSYEPEVAHPDADWGHEYHPHISNDNKWLVYMASNGCHWDYSCNNEIFLHRLGTGPSERIRITNDPSFDGFPDMYIGPSWQRTDAPRLVAAPNRLTFFARGAAVPAAQTIKIKNGGGGQLGAAQAVVDPPADWLSVQTTNATITASVREGKIARGRRKATITLTVQGAPGGPSIIPVTLDADESFPETIANVAPDAAATMDAVSPGSTSRHGCVYAPRGSGTGALAGMLAACVAIQILRRRAEKRL